jgi:hypothetical protein
MERRSKMPEQGQAQSRMNPEEARQKRIERKMRAIADPGSMVIAPRSSEGHLMVEILFNFDKGFNRLKTRAVTFIPLEEAKKGFESVDKLSAAFESLTKKLNRDAMDDASNGTSVYDDYRNKGMYAQQSNTYVFIPRQPESRKIAALLRVIDSGVMRLRTTATNMDVLGRTLEELIALIRSFYEETESIAKMGDVRTNYRTLSRIKGMLGMNGNGGGKVDGNTSGREKK